MILVPQHHPLATHAHAPTLTELAALPLVSYESSLKSDSSLQRAFAALDLKPKISMTAGDAELIKTYVRAGLGIGVLAEMAMQPSDLADLTSLSADHLLPACTTWIVLRREGVLRNFVLEFIAQFAPHLQRREVTRPLRDDQHEPWPAAPHWRERLIGVLSDAA